MKRKKRDLNKALAKKILTERCGQCWHQKFEHEDWIATGEYAPNSLCPTMEMDESGRYRKLLWFRPMTNLDYLEWKANG